MDREPLVTRREQWLKLRRWRRINTGLGLLNFMNVLFGIHDGSLWKVLLYGFVTIACFSMRVYTTDTMSLPYYRDES